MFFIHSCLICSILISLLPYTITTDYTIYIFLDTSPSKQNFSMFNTDHSRLRRFLNASIVNIQMLNVMNNTWTTQSYGNVYIVPNNKTDTPKNSAA